MHKSFESTSPLPSEALKPARPYAASWYLRILLWMSIPFVLWWFLKDISLPQIAAVLSRLRVLAIAALFLLNGLILVLFSSRWWVILRAQGYPRPYRRLVLYRLAAFGVSYFTPGPQFGGEPLQVYLLRKREGLPMAEAIASVTIDKLFELVANFSFLLVGALTIILTGILGNEQSPELLLIPASLLVIPLGFLLALRLGSHPFSALFFVLSRRLGDSARLQDTGRTIRSAETQIIEFYQKKPGALILSGVLSILIWLLMIYEFSLALRWLGAPLSFPQTLVVLTAARLAFLLPFPGGLGSLEASQVLAMEMLGIDPAVGISLSLVIRTRDVLTGGVGLWLGGLFNR